MPFTEKEMHITLQEQATQATVASQQTMSSDEEHLTCPETGEPEMVQVASDNQELVSSTQACAKATLCSGAKHVVGMAKEAVHNSIEIATTVAGTSVNKLMGSSGGQMVTSSIDAVLMKPEELMMVHYPLVTDEGLAKLAASLEGAEVTSVEQQKQEQSDSVRVGSLPAEDHQHSLAKMDRAEQMAQEALSQLRQTIDLIKYVKQGIEKNYYGQATLSRSRGELKGNEADGAAQPEQMESHTLAMSCTTIQQLQSTCLILLSIIHDLPTLIQDKIQKVHHSMEELHLCFSSAASFQDLSHEVLNQSQEKVNDAKKSLDELLQYEIQSIPLT